MFFVISCHKIILIYNVCPQVPYMPTKIVINHYLTKNNLHTWRFFILCQMNDPGYYFTSKLLNKS